MNRRIAKIEILATLSSVSGLAVVLAVGASLLLQLPTPEFDRWTAAAVAVATVAVLAVVTWLLFRFQAALRVFLRWLSSILIDSVFLVVWALVQWFASSKIISNFELTGLDRAPFLVFQGLFAFATLLPIIVYIYLDIRALLLQVRGRIQQQVDSDRSQRPDDAQARALDQDLRFFLRVAISMLIDSAFLAAWVFVQWLVSAKIIPSLGLSGVARIPFSVFQLLFFVSTLVPVVVYIFVDTRTIVLQVHRRVIGESDLDTENHQDS